MESGFLYTELNVYILHYSLYTMMNKMAAFQITCVSYVGQTATILSIFVHLLYDTQQQKYAFNSAPWWTMSTSRLLFYHKILRLSLHQSFYSQNCLTIQSFSFRSVLQKLKLGTFLLFKAFKIFLQEGERQIRPVDLRRSQIKI